MKVNTTGNSSGMFLEYCLKNIFIVRSPSSSYLKSSIAVCIFNVIFGIVGTFLNTLVLFVFLKSKNMRQKSSYFCIMILSATDLIVVTSVPVMFLLSSIPEILGTPQCFSRICFVIVSRTTPLLSATSLIIMNIERYLAIVHPILHRNSVTKGKIIFTFIVIALIFFTCAAINFAWKSIGLLIYSVGAFMICSITLFQYVSIFFIARKAVFGQVTKLSNEDTTMGNIRPNLRDLKMARTCFFIVFLCFICYLPIAIIAGVWQHFFPSKETWNALFNCILWLTPLITMNATINCLIFFWGNRELRKQGLKLVRNCFRSTSNWRIQMIWKKLSRSASLLYQCSSFTFSVLFQTFQTSRNCSHEHDLKYRSSLPGFINYWKLKIVNIYGFFFNFWSWSYITLNKSLEQSYLDPPIFLIKLDWTFEYSATSPLPQQPQWLVEAHLTRGLTTSGPHYATKSPPYDWSYTIGILAYV